jgi:hypothetical protein
VDCNATTKTYAESTGPVLRHSPILGWARDGYPIYGPYGFSVANNPASGIRRMVSGYQLRNGQNGADNLSTTRPTIPAWAQRLYGVSATQAGPSVNTTYPLGRYMEDNAYLGDLGKTKGVDFDLDEYNGRTCVTPEFPEGTYAYFVAIDANGAPKFPYNIGRAFYGNPTGSTVAAIAETVVTAFKGGPVTQETMNPPVLTNGNVAVSWNSVEGATYKLEATDDVATTWAPLNSSVSASAGTTTQTTETAGANGRPQRFYRVTRTAIATYDNSVPSGGILSVSPSSGAPGQSFTMTVNLDPTATPAPPPQNAPVNAVTVGTISATNLVHVSQAMVTCTLAIPAGAATGAQSVTVTFPGPPANPTQTVSYTLANGFNITAASPMLAAAVLSTASATPTDPSSGTTTTTRSAKRVDRSRR